MIVRSKLLS